MENTPNPPNPPNTPDQNQLNQRSNSERSNQNQEKDPPNRNFQPNDDRGVTDTKQPRPGNEDSRKSDPSQSIIHDDEESTFLDEEE